MATLATLGSSSVLRFQKPEPPKTRPSSQLLGFVTSQLSGVKISYNIPDLAPIKPISAPFTPALRPVARKSSASLLFTQNFCLYYFSFMIKFLGWFQFCTLFLVPLCEISLLIESYQFCYASGCF